MLRFGTLGFPPEELIEHGLGMLQKGAGCILFTGATSSVRGG